MRNVLSKIADIVCFMGGAALTAYGIFGLSYRRSYGTGVPAYSYGPEQITEIAAGISLVVLGFLIRSWTRHRADDFIK